MISAAGGRKPSGLIASGGGALKAASARAVSKLEERKNIVLLNVAVGGFTKGNKQTWATIPVRKAILFYSNLQD